MHWTIIRSAKACYVVIAGERAVIERGTIWSHSRAEASAVMTLTGAALAARELAMIARRIPLREDIIRSSFPTGD